MNQTPDRASVPALARSIDAEIRALPVQNTPSVRGVRREYSRRLREADPAFVLALARELLENYGQRWVAYELVAGHEGAFQHLPEAELEELGRGIDSWSSVDSFARILAGPAWRDGLVSDDLIQQIPSAQASAGFRLAQRLSEPSSGAAPSARR
jgi:hypothetical protein